MKKMLLILPLLAACTPAPTAAPDGRQIGGDACGASQYADKIGQSLGSARFPPNSEMRLINPGEMVTQEYIPTRLNVEIDGPGRIVAVTCG
jgi:hypothetical protein